MLSPLYDKEMDLKTHYNRVFYKNRVVVYKQFYYLCSETKSKFTNSRIDQINITSMIGAYAKLLDAEVVSINKKNKKDA